MTALNALPRTLVCLPDSRSHVRWFFKLAAPDEVHAALWSMEAVDVPLRLIGRHHRRKVRTRVDRLLDGRAGEVALLAKGIDLAGAHPDLNDLLVELPPSPEVSAIQPLELRL